MSVETEIALIKQDISNITDLIGRVDVSLNKMSEAAFNISKILAVHEEKINSNERANNELEKMFEIRRKELDQNIKEIHSRITTTQREISSDLSDSEKRITNAIKELKQEVEKERKEVIDEVRKLERRVSTLERWKWIVMGGAATIGFLFANVLPIFNMSPK